MKISFTVSLPGPAVRARRTNPEVAWAELLGDIVRHERMVTLPPLSTLAGAVGGSRRLAVSNVRWASSWSVIRPVQHAAVRGLHGVGAYLFLHYGAWVDDGREQEATSLRLAASSQARLFLPRRKVRGTCRHCLRKTSWPRAARPTAVGNRCSTAGLRPGVPRALAE